MIPLLLWSHGYLSQGCTISFQVPLDSFKKTGKFCNFQIQFFCRNSAKNGRKCPKSKSPDPSIKNLSSLQISAHLAFKWPRKSKKTNFWGGHCLFCGCSGYRVINLCKNLATRGPFGPSLRSVLINLLRNPQCNTVLQRLLTPQYVSYNELVSGWTSLEILRDTIIYTDI